MIELLGYEKLKDDLTQLARFQQRVQRSQTGKINSYRTKAQEIVRSVVYAPRENPRYPRSGNLAAATDASVVGSTGVVATYVFLNPDRASRAFAYQYHGRVEPQGLRSYYNIIGKGGAIYYPSYVRRGIFFRRRLPARDFVAAWATHFMPVYKKDVGQAIRNFRTG